MSKTHEVSRAWITVNPSNAPDAALNVFAGKVIAIMGLNNAEAYSDSLALHEIRKALKCLEAAEKREHAENMKEKHDGIHT